MKRLVFLFMLISGIISALSAQNQNFYSFTVKTIDGDMYPLSQLRGKKVLVVNTASKCGNTPQYKDLETLYQKYGGSHFVIIGFPANNFGSQEPGSNAEIKEFCTSQYQVTFPMMSKISVKGDDIAPLYQWLTSKAKNGVLDAPVTWNFQKFMVNEKGELVDFAPPKENPLSDRIVNWVSGVN